MRLAFLLAFLIGSPMASAQAILKLDSLDATVYPELLDRVRAGDMDVDYQRMRLAYTLTDAYAPYDIDPKKQKQRMFDLLFQKQTPEAALLVADSVLAGRYVDLDAQYGAGVAHDMLGNADQAAFHFALFEGLMDSILRTAEGTQDDPFIVIATDEEYTLIGVLGLENKGQSLMTCNGVPCDLLELHDSTDGADMRFFFDVSIPFGQMRRDLGE
ncbi:MAG: hypothetical protein Rubg2KO_11880 [Rubricoccaceae bacterium]